MAASLPHYGLDIETDTTVDGLDPTCSPVIAAAVAGPSEEAVLLGEERAILTQLEEFLASLPPGVIVTWNGAAFDLPFLATRASMLGVPISLRLFPTRGPATRASWGPHAHLDGYLLYRADVGRVLGLSCGLKAMARLTGLAPVEVDREAMHTLPDDRLGSYVASDARLARHLVQRRLPAAARFIDDCPTGSTSPRDGRFGVTAG